MSYCRWSSDDFQCDVYVYEDCGGWWQTYVAGRKRRLREGAAFPPHGDGDPVEEYVSRHAAVMEIIHEKNEGVLWDWEELTGPHAGASYQDGSPGACAERLEEIRASGLNVPQYAIDALRAEESEREDPVSP